MNNPVVFFSFSRGNLLNEYFYSVFTNDDGILPTFPRRVPDSSPGICDIVINSGIISKVIRKLKVNSAPGPDGLPPIFFRETQHFIIFPLEIMFRTFVDLHEIPDQF